MPPKKIPESGALRRFRSPEDIFWVLKCPTKTPEGGFEEGVSVGRGILETQSRKKGEVV